MNREEILEKSKKDSKGKLDERELAAYGKAGRVGMLVGGLMCLFLVILGRHILNVPELSFAGWMVYWSMMGSNSLALAVVLKEKSRIAWGVIFIIVAVVYGVATIITMKG